MMEAMNKAGIKTMDPSGSPPDRKKNNTTPNPSPASDGASAAASSAINPDADKAKAELLARLNALDANAGP